MYLGIDGGGTTTEFALINRNGKILSHVIKSTFYHRQTSYENFKKILSEGINEICSSAKININDIDYAFLGLPGYGEVKEEIPILTEITKSVLRNIQFRCDNDSVVAWAGSLACRPGINIVAGTGAIAFGINKSGITARSNGWGHEFGDEGSAYWLGKKLLEVFTKESDGRLKKSPLYYLLKEELYIESDFDLINIITIEYNLDRDKIANLAKILFSAALKEDLNALKIYEDASYELYLSILSVIHKLEFEAQEQINVSYSGGVFKAKDLIISPLEKYLNHLGKNIYLMEPILSPVVGAALYALTIHTNDLSEFIITSLVEEEKKWKIHK